MDSIRRARAHQQRRVQSHANDSDALAFFNLLTSSELLDEVESLLPEYRERLYPPTETLSMFLAQALSADRSCQKAVNEAAVKRLVEGLPPCSTHPGAYCQARQRLPVDRQSRLWSCTRGSGWPSEPRSRGAGGGGRYGWWMARRW